MSRLPARGGREAAPAGLSRRSGSRRGATLWLLALGVSLLASDCSGAGRRDSRQDLSDEPAPPSWAISGRAPSPAGGICAVGVAGPTFFRSDAVERASEAARSELARTLEVRIQSSMLDVQTDSGLQKGSQTVLEISSFANEIVLKNSQIAEVWFDEHGRGFVHQPHYTYALACVDSSSLPR